MAQALTYKSSGQGVSTQQSQSFDITLIAPTLDPSGNLIAIDTKQVPIVDVADLSRICLVLTLHASGLTAASYIDVKLLGATFRFATEDACEFYGGTYRLCLAPYTLAHCLWGGVQFKSAWVPRMKPPELVLNQVPTAGSWPIIPAVGVVDGRLDFMRLEGFYGS